MIKLAKNLIDRSFDGEHVSIYACFFLVSRAIENQFRFIESLNFY